MIVIHQNFYNTVLLPERGIETGGEVRFFIARRNQNRDGLLERGICRADFFPEKNVHRHAKEQRRDNYQDNEGEDQHNAYIKEKAENCGTISVARLLLSPIQNQAHWSLPPEIESGSTARSLLQSANALRLVVR